jgi:DNA-binding NarL/FixJ family response regulator
MPAPKQSVAKVLIVDDHPAVREALTMRISELPDLEVCGEAEDVTGALELVDAQKPDLAVVDISLATGDGLDLIKRIKARNKYVQMLVWSMHSEDVYAERAFRAGARGFISKVRPTRDIVDAIRCVLQGKLYVSPALSERLLESRFGSPGIHSGGWAVDSLSDRELEVFRLIGQGKKTAEVAAHLHVSVKTVETYGERIRKKLNLSNSAQLRRYAAEWVLGNRPRIG